MSNSFYLVILPCVCFLISFTSVFSQTSSIKISTTTTTINTSPPSIQSVTIGTGNQINLKWTPNRVTTTNTRYRINVINKNNIIPSFEYPGN